MQKDPLFKEGAYVLRTVGDKSAEWADWKVRLFRRTIADLEKRAHVLIHEAEQYRKKLNLLEAERRQ